LKRYKLKIQDNLIPDGEIVDAKHLLMGEAFHNTDGSLCMRVYNDAIHHHPKMMRYVVLESGRIFFAKLETRFSRASNATVVNYSDKQLEEMQGV
jgi:hypothetical protein